MIEDPYHVSLNKQGVDDGCERSAFGPVADDIRAPGRMFIDGFKGMGVMPECVWALGLGINEPVGWIPIEDGGGPSDRYFSDPEGVFDLSARVHRDWCGRQYMESEELGGDPLEVGCIREERENIFDRFGKSLCRTKDPFCGLVGCAGDYDSGPWIV